MPINSLISLNNLRIKFQDAIEERLADLLLTIDGSYQVREHRFLFLEINN